MITHEEKSYVQKAKDFGSSVISSVRNFFSSSNSQSEANSATAVVKEIPSMEETRQMCLALYLEDYLSVLRSGTIDISVNPMDIIEDVAIIYHCLYAPTIHNGKGKSHHTKEWKCDNCKNVRKDLY